MGEKGKAAGRLSAAATAEKGAGSAAMEKVRGVRAPSPKKAVQGSAMKALKLPGLRAILHSLALARLIRVLRRIVGLIGLRAVPIVALILGGWIFRRVRRRR